MMKMHGQTTLTLESLYPPPPVSLMKLIVYPYFPESGNTTYGKMLNVKNRLNFMIRKQIQTLLELQEI